MNNEVPRVTKATILVVDDTPDNLSLMMELLEGDYTVKLANGGERALKLAEMTPHPDLILLDIMMPGMDGYEVCQKLKAKPQTREIPVVFLTAKTDVDDERKGLEIGAVDYITKPISPPIVLARVKIHLALKAHADFLRDKRRLSRSGGLQAHPRGGRDSGRHHFGYGIPCRNTGLRYGQPHPPHPALRACPGVQAL